MVKVVMRTVDVYALADVVLSSAFIAIMATVLAARDRVETEDSWKPAQWVFIRPMGSEVSSALLVDADGVRNTFLSFTPIIGYRSPEGAGWDLIQCRAEKGVSTITFWIEGGVLQRACEDIRVVQAGAPVSALKPR
jgi:hypothetical protein